MTQVTKESLAKRIAELESGPRSLKEDYQLEAFKMLLEHLECDHVWLQTLASKTKQCIICDEIRELE